MTEQVLSYSGGWAFLGEVGKLTPVAVATPHIIDGNRQNSENQSDWKSHWLREWNNMIIGKCTQKTEQVQRGWMFDLAEGFLVKMTAGTPGENVTVAAWKGGKVHKQSMVADDRGEGAAIFQ